MTVINGELVFNPTTQRFETKADLAGISDVALSLEITRVASEDLDIGDTVYAVNSTNVGIGDIDTYEKASVIGIATNTALTGENVTVKLLGVFTDPQYAAIPNGVPVFQDTNGKLTTAATTIVGEFWTRIGDSLGGGSILVKPEEPTEVL